MLAAAPQLGDASQAQKPPLQRMPRQWIQWRSTPLLLRPRAGLS
jgi:hypothetical protein